MSIAAGFTLIVFLLFFGLIIPVFLYWFNRFLKTAWTQRVSFIGFPQDEKAVQDRDDRSVEET